MEAVAGDLVATGAGDLVATVVAASMGLRWGFGGGFIEPSFDPTEAMSIITAFLAEPPTEFNAAFRAQIVQAVADGRIKDALNLTNIEITKLQGNPFGLSSDQFLGQGDLDRANALAIAQAGSNPFGLTSDQWVAMQAELARNGLSVEDFISEAGLDRGSNLALAQEGTATAQATSGNPFGLNAGQRISEQALNRANALSISAQETNPFDLTSDQYVDLTNQGLREGLSAKDFQDLEATRARNGLGADQFIQLENSLARGGLTAPERLKEIQAQGLPGILELLGNPSLLGTLTGLGSNFGGGQLPTGASGDQGGLFSTIPTLSGLRNTSNEGLRFLEGGFATQGITPSALANLVGSVSPTGGRGSSTFSPLTSVSGVR
jgi:hypothetical protein